MFGYCPKNKISFQDAFARLTDEQQAIYDELMTREYKTKLNQVYGADWIKKLHRFCCIRPH